MCLGPKTLTYGSQFDIWNPESGIRRHALCPTNLKCHALPTWHPQTQSKPNTLKPAIKLRAFSDDVLEGIPEIALHADSLQNEIDGSV